MVKRIDSNGNEFTVEAFKTKKEAEDKIAELTENIHKQGYWVEKIN